MPTEPKGIQGRLIRKILDLSEEEQLALLTQLEGDSILQLQDDSNPPDELEKRKSKRKEYQNAVNFFHGIDSFWGLIHNISKTGIYIETDESFESGWSLTAILPLPNTDKTIEVPIKVSRKDPDGIGVEFIKKT